MDTRLDTPPFSGRRHPKSPIAPEDWAAANVAIGRLVAHSRDHGLMYHSVGVALREIASAKRAGAVHGAGAEGTAAGEPPSGQAADIDALRRSLDDMVRGQHHVIVPMCRVTMAERLLAAGRPEEAESVVEAAVMALGPGMAGIDGPEVLRIQGIVIVALGRRDEGEALLLRAVALAREQSALSWELRAATSLVRIRGARGEAAASILGPVLARFPEGAETGDLMTARAML